MLTQLSDIIDVTVFQDLPAVNSPEKTAFWESGIINNSALLNQLAGSAGKTAELPFWNDLDATSEVNYSDDTENSATPVKIAQGEQISRKAFVNKGWKEADLASELALGGDALTQVRNRVDTYFTRQWQRRLIASTNGVLADNVANDSGDMLINVASESIAGQTAATKFSRNNFTSAIYTLGDMATMIKAIGVHSAIMKQMVDADDIDFIPDSEGKLTIPTYLGVRVIVDDSLTVTAGTTDGFKYTSVLFGENAFGYGTATPKVPVEVNREAAEGNGGGTEALWVRKTWLIHPFGFQHTGTPAGESFTLAEMAGAGVWDRVVERKNIPLGFLITN